MLDIGASELLMIVIVAILVIGPKDMPMALRQAGRWIGKIRRVSNHFRTGLDAMIREAEMEDMEKKWRDQNAKIMADNPSPPMTELEAGAVPAHSTGHAVDDADPKAVPSPDDSAGAGAESRALPKPQADAPLAESAATDPAKQPNVTETLSNGQKLPLDQASSKS